ncbi:nitroreductase family protein [Simiduia litorea]|uniref:nitroreductase family protein n=1 Tax=Simiduia litorea TaxID=1435348 RepID=UPI0036F3FC97
MVLQQLIQQRRSVKQFEPSYTLSNTEITQLLEDAIHAPTSFNLQHWRFVRISDPALRKAIRAVAWDQAQVTDASELFVIAADVKAWEREPERYWASADSEKRSILLGMIDEFYRGREWIQRDEAIRSGAFAAQNMMLSAKSLGLDSCPMIGFNQEAVAKLINLPADHVIVMMVAVGKAAGDAWPRGGQLPLSELVFDNQFSAPALA